MEINIFENEYAFSTTKLCFPSISGCRAIVFQTPNGLFGVHQSSGPHSEKFERFGEKLAKFVTDHTSGTGKGVNLYGAAYLSRPNSAYNDPGARQEHMSEMSAYAKKLKFTGSITCFDLSTALGGGGSAYVEMEAKGGLCDVYASSWINPGPAKVTFDQSRKNNHKLSYHSKDEYISPSKMLVKVDPIGRKKLEAWVRFS